MSFFQKIIGSISGNVAEVDDNNQILTVTNTDDQKTGKVRAMMENDGGVLTNVAYLKSPEVSDDYRLRVGIDTILFFDQFNSTAQNTAVWKYTSSTQTAIQTGGFLYVNNGASAAAGTSVSMQTWQYFPMIGTAPLYCELTGGFTDSILGGQIYEFGTFIPNASSDPADGIYFRFTSAGIQGVMNYNNNETSTGELPFSFLPDVMHKFTLVAGQREIEFWVDDNFIGEIATPNGNGQPMLAGSSPFSISSRNTGAVAGTPAQLKAANITITLADLNTSKTWPQTCSVMGSNGYQAQNGSTMGQLAQWANTAEPTAGTATNTTAALGAFPIGLFKANAMATSATDIIIASYQNPAGSVTQTAKNLVVNGIWIDVVNQVVDVATTPFTFAIAASFGHTAVSQATAETGSFVTGTTNAPRKVPLGILHLPIGAVVGQPSNNPIYRQFAAPIVIPPGKFFAIVAKVLRGTATATETLLFSVGFDAHYE